MGGGNAMKDDADEDDKTPVPEALEATEGDDTVDPVLAAVRMIDDAEETEDDTGAVAAEEAGTAGALPVAGADDAAGADDDSAVAAADDPDDVSTTDAWDDATEAADAEDVHDTIVHLQVLEHTRPQDGADDADEPLPVSHSSPAVCVTMPSPHFTRVQLIVHFGPLPLRVPSSHSSGATVTPFPQLGVACPTNCPFKRVAPRTATTANSAASPRAIRRVSSGKLFRKRTAPSSGEEATRAIGWNEAFWWSRLPGLFSKTLSCASRKSFAPSVPRRTPPKTS